MAIVTNAIGGNVPYNRFVKAVLRPGDAVSTIYNNGNSGIGATITNSGSQAALICDGVTVSLNDRVIVPFMSSKYQNGIYVVTNTGSVSTNWVLTRLEEFDSPGEIVTGSLVGVESGDNYSSATFQMISESVTSVGSSNIIFTIQPNAISLMRDYMVFVYDYSTNYQDGGFDTLGFLGSSNNNKGTMYAATTSNLSATYFNGVANDGFDASLAANSNGVLTIDGVTPPQNSYILVKDQSSAFQNGIYRVDSTGSVSSPYVLIRSRYWYGGGTATNSDQPYGFINNGDMVLVSNGTLNANNIFKYDESSDPVVGTDSISFISVGKTPTLDNLLWIANNGNDTTGNGSMDKPFLTLSGMYNKVTDASKTKGYTVFDIRGETVAGITESSISFKPYISVFGNGTKINIGSVVSDAAWSSLTDEAYGLWDGYVINLLNDITFSLNPSTTAQRAFARSFYLNNITGVTSGGYTIILDGYHTDGNQEIAYFYLNNVICLDKGSSFTYLSLINSQNSIANNIYFRNFSMSYSVMHANGFTSFYVSNSNIGTSCIFTKTDGSPGPFYFEMRNSYRPDNIVINAGTTGGLLNISLDDSCYRTPGSVTGTAFKLDSVGEARGLNFKNVDGAVHYLSEVGENKDPVNYTNAGARSDPILSLDYELNLSNSVSVSSLVSNSSILANCSIKPNYKILGNGFNIDLLNAASFGLDSSWSITSSAYSLIENVSFTLDNSGPEWNLVGSSDDNISLLEFRDFRISQNSNTNICNVDIGTLNLQFNNCYFNASNRFVLISGGTILFNGGYTGDMLCNSTSTGTYNVIIKNCIANNALPLTFGTTDNISRCNVTISNVYREDPNEFLNISLINNTNLFIDSETYSRSNILYGCTVSSTTQVSGGTGWTHATVVFSSPDISGGITATATANITAGSIDSLSITNAGSGYTSPPTISFIGDGTGAVFTSSLNPTFNGVQFLDNSIGIGVSGVSNTNYTPTEPSSGALNYSITNHLQGINNALGVVSDPGYIYQLTPTNITNDSLIMMGGSISMPIDSMSGPRYVRVDYNQNTEMKMAYSGLNGFDNGSSAADTWYYIVAVADSSGVNTPGFIWTAAPSTDDTVLSPTLPSGYDIWRVVGAIKTTPSSATDFLIMNVQGTGNRRTFYWNEIAPTTQLLLYSGTTQIVSGIPTYPCQPPSMVRRSDASGTWVIGQCQSSILEIECFVSIDPPYGVSTYQLLVGGLGAVQYPVIRIPTPFYYTPAEDIGVISITTGQLNEVANGTLGPNKNAIDFTLTGTGSTVTSILLYGKSFTLDV